MKICPGAAAFLALILTAAFSTQAEEPGPIPEVEGLPPETTERLKRVMDTWHDAGLFDGAVLVARDGVAWTDAAGFAIREEQVPNTPATRFPIASLTKQFTAVLTMRLVESGRIDLDTPISHYLPWYRKDVGDRITVRDLLSHTAGLPEVPLKLLFEPGAADRGARGLVERHDPGPFVFDPGTDFAYTNTDYQLLGAILEEVWGEPFESILRTEILAPLGMENTGIARSDAALPGRAVDYSPQVTDGETTWVRTPEYHWENWHAAGAMYSTVEDLNLWNAALTGGRLLDGDLYDLMLTPRTDVGSTGNYVALGSWVYPRALPGSDEQPVIVERRGAIGGFAALNAFARDGEWWIAILANSYNEQIHQLPWGSSMPLDLILVLYGLDPEGPPKG